MSEPTSEPPSGTHARVARPRRPLPPIRVHRTLPPGAVPRPRTTPPTDPTPESPAESLSGGPGPGSRAAGPTAGSPPAGQPPAVSAAGSPAARSAAGSPVARSAAGSPVAGSAAGSPAGWAGFPAAGAGGATAAGTGRPRRVWIPVAAGVALLALVAGLFLATNGSGGDGAEAPDRTVAAAPPALRLAQPPAGAAPAAPQAPADLRVAGSLPPGPQRGTVAAYAPSGPAPRAEVARLAAALGIGGEPVRDGAGWTVHAGMATLRVSDVSGWAWELTADTDRPPAIEPGRPRGPGILAVRAQAEGVLNRLGGGYGPLRPAGRSAAYADVAAAPTVDGLPTAGLETRLRFDPELRLIAAGGWLARPAAGPAYPLLQARAALEAAPGSMGCPPACAEATSATPGLALRWQADGRALLVPAWLFEVRGSAVPLTTLAVTPAYLAGAEPEPSDAMPIPLPTR